MLKSKEARRYEKKKHTAAHIYIYIYIYMYIFLSQNAVTFANIIMAARSEIVVPDNKTLKPFLKTSLSY